MIQAAAQTGPATVLAEAEKTQQLEGHGSDLFCTVAHGFVPISPPQRQLPSSHAPWDDLAADLPRLLRDRQILAAVRDLPELAGDQASLEAPALCRAAAILGHLVHGWVRSHPEQFPTVPNCLMRPWSTVSERLKRPAPFLSSADFVAYNWRLKDPEGPRILENMEVLVPTMGNDAERVSMLTVTEILAQSGPLLAAVVGATEAVLADDRGAVAANLDQVRSALDRLTYNSFLKLEANSWAKQYADPIVWAKLVAPFGAPTRPDEPGFSGTETPTFQILDALFRRQEYGSALGQESKHNLSWLHSDFQRLHRAVAAVDLREWIRRRDDRELEGLYQGALDAYAGERGFLGIHRLKLYGYIELGFKTGRSATNGGFSTAMGPRPWDLVDDHIEAARRERYEGVTLRPSTATLSRSVPVVKDPDVPVRRLTLDTRGQGLRYQPGDRCAVLPQSRPADVKETLRVLRAEGQQEVGITAEWRAHLLRHGEVISSREEGAFVQLGTFLRYARLRPIERSTLRRVARLTGARALGEILEARAEDQWDFVGLCELINRQSNYDLRRLWRAAPWESESLSSLLPPDRYRLYSIASSQRPTDEGPVDELSLTVGGLSYRAERGPHGEDAEVTGTASTYLLGSTQAGEADLPIRIHRPSRFHLPADSSRPIVMFAAGTGIAPFIGFIQNRLDTGANGHNLLLFGARTRKQLYYEALLSEWSEDARFQVEVAFSREATRWQPKVSPTAFEPGPQRRVDGLLRQEPTLQNQVLQALLPVADGGDGGSAYICGQSAFAQSVISALKLSLESHFEGQMEDVEQAANRAAEQFYRLSGEGRLMLDIFTPFKPAMAPGVLGNQSFDASEIAQHNNPVDGYWMVIRGQVYDLNEFIHLHPGGAKILISSAGMDATVAYEKVEHHLNSEVHAMLDMYKMGSVRRLDLGSAWGYALTAAGPKVVSLGEAYRAWVRFLYRVVELENALVNDLSVHGLPLTDQEQPDEVTPLKSALFAETIERVLGSVIEELLGKDLEYLWCVTTGLWAPDCPLSLHIDGNRQLLAGPSRARARQQLQDWNQQLVARSMGDDPRAGDMAIGRGQQALEQQVTTLLSQIKGQLCGALKVFERYEADSLHHGSDILLAVFPGIRREVAGFLDGLCRTMAATDFGAHVEKESP